MEHRCGFINSSLTLDDVTTINTGPIKFELRIDTVILQRNLEKDAPPPIPEVTIDGADDPPTSTPRVQKQTDATDAIASALSKVLAKLDEHDQLFKQLAINASSRPTTPQQSEHEDTQPDLSEAEQPRTPADNELSTRELRGRTLFKRAAKIIDLTTSKRARNDDVIPDQTDGADDILNDPEDYCDPQAFEKFKDYLTGKKQLTYECSLHAREDDYSETAARLALLTQFSAPPLSIVTKGVQTDTLDGPFWTLPVLHSSNPHPANSKIGIILASDYIRMSSAKNKY